MTINELYALFLKTNGVCTDTRNLIPGSIFFALKGDNFNANQFTNQAVEKGCALAIADETPERPDDRIIVVENVLETLQALGQHHRRQFEIPVIGLTGSNGKTTTKELMAAVLNKKFKVHATKGNLNNHIGVPLTLLSMSLDTDIAIIEMGANNPDDIGELCEIAEPNYGMITNIGRAHIEGFGSIEGVSKAKGQLFEYLQMHNRLVFVNSSDPKVTELCIDMKQFTYSTDNDSADVFGKLTSPGLQISFEWQTNYYRSGNVQTQLTGGYNLPNLLAAACVGTYFKVDPESISQALAQYQPSNNRSQIQKTDHNTLILDAYNANPTSVEKALRDFAAVEVPGEKMIIIGDMLELGTESDEAHNAIIALIEELHLNGILVGTLFKKAVTRSASEITSFENTGETKEYLNKNTPRNQYILIKGSRGIQLEKLVEVL